MIRWWRYRICGILILFSLLIIIFPATTGFSNTTLRVGVYDFKPLSTTSVSDDEGGMLIRILKYAAEKEKWYLQFVPGTVQDGFNRLKSGEIDLLVAAPYSQNKAAAYDFSREAVISTWAQIYALPDQKELQSLLDLRNLNIGVVRDDPYAPELRKTLTGLNISCNFIEFNDYHELFAAIKNKWIDAGAVDRFYGILHGKHYGAVASPIIFSPVELRYATAKDSNLFILRTLNYYIDLLKKNPDSIYYRLVDQIAGTSRDARFYKILIWSISLTAVFLCIFALMNLFLRVKIRKRTEELYVKNKELENEINKRYLVEKALRESRRTLPHHGRKVICQCLCRTKRQIPFHQQQHDQDAGIRFRRNH